MKARNFRYIRPVSLAHAYQILAEAGGDAVPVAGGQSLLAGLNMRLSAPKLLVDIGNSRIKWRIAHVDPGTPDMRWLTSEQTLASNDRQQLPGLFAVHAGVAVDTVLLSNVSSDAAETFVRESASRLWPDPTVRSLRPVARQCGVVNGYRMPEKLGPDRWLALIGAHALHPARTLLVCSFGTATTIDLLVMPGTGDARFVGGLILPGFEAMRAALSTTTARLPLAAGRAVAFADDTDDAVTSGIAAAQAGAVERAWRNAVMTADPSLCLLAGGGAPTVAALLAGLDVPFDVAHDLVLQGMATVASHAMETAPLTPTVAKTIR